MEGIRLPSHTLKFGSSVSVRPSDWSEGAFYAECLHRISTRWQRSGHPKDTFTASFVPVSWRCTRVIFVGEGVDTGIAAGLDFFFRQFNLQEHYHKITMLGLNTSAIKGLLKMYLTNKFWGLIVFRAMPCHMVPVKLNYPHGLPTFMCLAEAFKNTIRFQ